MDPTVTPGIDRRLHQREQGVGERSMRARVRPGHTALIVNLSAGGALIEVATRLLPGKSVELQFERGAERVLVRGRLVRCRVVDVHPARMRYQAAVAFDRAIPSLSQAGSEYVLLGSGQRR